MVSGPRIIANERVREILSGYEKDKITLATYCSHSSLQIFHGARREGFKTMGIYDKGKNIKYYDAFPKAKPDDFFYMDSIKDLPKVQDELIKENVVLVPHGSLVEYTKVENFGRLYLPTFGNKAVLAWESDRKQQRKWLESSGIKMPREFLDPDMIDRPVLVKRGGAKGGRGFFIVRSADEFRRAAAKMGYDKENYTIQEYILGTRYYIHYFYSPLQQKGYSAGEGTLELLSMDRRDETNIDEIYKLGSQTELREMKIYPTFVVTGNVPLVIRESLLPQVMSMGERVVEKSIELFGGMVGSFCLETVVTDKLEFFTFEISARIVAGTNPFPLGSAYSAYMEEPMSTGQRIAREIKTAAGRGLLAAVLS